jgi:hypothetical protein
LLVRRGRMKEKKPRSLASCRVRDGDARAFRGLASRARGWATARLSGCLARRAKRTCTTLNLSNPGHRFSSKISLPERSFATKSVPVVIASVRVNERKLLAVPRRALARRGLASRGASRAPGGRARGSDGGGARGAFCVRFFLRVANFRSIFPQVLGVLSPLLKAHHPCPPPSVAPRRSASGLPCAPPRPPRGPPRPRSRPSRRTGSPSPQVRPRSSRFPGAVRDVDAL